MRKVLEFVIQKCYDFTAVMNGISQRQCYLMAVALALAVTWLFGVLSTFLLVLGFVEAAILMDLKSNPNYKIEFGLASAICLAFPLVGLAVICPVYWICGGSFPWSGVLNFHYSWLVYGTIAYGAARPFNFLTDPGALRAFSKRKGLNQPKEIFRAYTKVKDD